MGVPGGLTAVGAAIASSTLPYSGSRYARPVIQSAFAGRTGTREDEGPGAGQRFFQCPTMTARQPVSIKVTADMSTITCPFRAGLSS